MKFSDRVLSNGIYDVTGIDVILAGNAKDESDLTDITKNFIKAHPDYAVASAYETYTTMILASKPKKITFTNKTYIGSGFDYGSTTILRDLPKDILILAENN